MRSLHLEYPVGIFKERAFEEQQRKEVFHALDDADVLAVMRVTRLAPLHFFGKVAFKKNFSQRIRFLTPIAGVAKQVSTCRFPATAVTSWASE
jgi:hypothetical protein